MKNQNVFFNSANTQVSFEENLKEKLHTNIWYVSPFHVDQFANTEFMS